MKFGKKAITILLSMLFISVTPLVGCDDEETPVKPYVENRIIVTFDYNDGGAARPRGVLVESGESIPEPAAPERVGYRFDYWQTEKNGGDTVTFPYTPESNVTLHAHWTPQQYTVTFDYNYEGCPASVEKTADYNGTVEAPEEIPDRGEDYTFRYWRTRADGGIQVAFPYTVKKDITLYAYWHYGKVYQVGIDANYEGAKELDGMELEGGDRIYEADMPKLTRSGYSLDGWSLTPKGELIEFPYTPDGNCTLYAIWSRAKVNVSFNYNYSGSPDSGIYERKQVEGGTDVSAPETDPERPNYTFVGWYTSSEGGTEVKFPRTVNRATTFYARWQHEPVQTDIFDAEFVEFDPMEKYPGYSSEVNGKGCIVKDTTEVGATTQYGDGMSGQGNYVSYLYKNGATLRFEIYADKAVDNVTLVARLGSESMVGNLAIAPTGDYAYQFKVNGTSLNYSSINLSNGKNFADYTISASVSLQEGLNVIELVTANSTKVGGTATASAPIVDCIKLQNHGDAVLTWMPIYDNLVI